MGTPSARRHLNPDQFSMVHEPGSVTHAIVAYHPAFGQGTIPVGHMIWDNQSGRITNIQVDEKHRRQGIGRRMYQEGQKHSPAPKHDVEKNRTALGKKWVRGVGGPSV